MEMNPQWRVSYPVNSIPFIDAFRQRFFDYDEIASILDDFFRQSDHEVRTICELGAGTGSNLFKLASRGYICLGVDANQESVEIARDRSAASQANVTFYLMDFNQELPDVQQDVVLVLFVPISKIDMRSLAIRAHQLLRPGGYFICMLLIPDPNNPFGDSYQNIEFSMVEDRVVVRINFYVKQSLRIEWDAIYLIGNEDHARLARDHDSLDLLGEGTTLELPDDLYRHVTRLSLSTCKPGQSPPMTQEILDVYQRFP